MKIGKKGFLLGCFLTASFIANATPITLSIGLGTTAYSLGDVNPGGSNAGGQGNAATAYTTEILSLALNGSTTISGETYNRSANVFASLPPPTATGADILGNSTSITLTQAYTYLEAKYGNNEFVWYIADFAVGTVFDIPSDGTGSIFGKQGTGLSDVTLLNPISGTQPNGSPIPDGGMTVAMLGMALTGMGLIARRFKI